MILSSNAEKLKVFVEKANALPEFNGAWQIDTALNGRKGTLAYVSLSKKFLRLQLQYRKNDYRPVISIKFPPKAQDFRLSVIEYLGENGFFVEDWNAKNPVIESYNTDIVQDIVEVFNLIESADFLEEGGVSWKTTNAEQRLSNVVKIIRLATDTNDTTLLKREMVDDLTPHVSVNEKTEAQNYGEHVVPIDFMFQNSVDMMRKGADDDTVLDYWKRNLRVFYITPAQARTLDVDLGLRTTMPKNWQDGDSPFQRLIEANINFIVDK